MTPCWIVAFCVKSDDQLVVPTLGRDIHAELTPLKLWLVSKSVKKVMKYFLLCSLPIIASCQATQTPLETVERVDLDRFMGDWFVLASIGTFIERGAYNAIETYELNRDGSIATQFRFRRGGFDGPLRTLHPIGYVTNENNAVWGMQFLWPFRADYRVLHLDDDYQTTVIGRNARDYVWVMARTPSVSEVKYAQMVELIEDSGYDISKLKRVPQRWPEMDAVGDG